MRRQMLGFICAMLALVATGPLLAQTGPTQSFEVASVRLSSPTTPLSHRITDARVDLIKIDLRQLLWMAFEIDPFCCRDRIPGAEPLGGVVVDIQATLPAGATRKRIPEMMKSLLTQRFGLRTHVEPRIVDGYELVVAKDGIRMKEVEAINDLDRVFPANPSLRTVRDSVRETIDGAVRTTMIPLGERTITERTMYDRTATARGTSQYDAARMTMSQLASILALHTGRPVVESTKLTGVYNFSIELPAPPFVGQGLAATGRTAAVDGTPLNQPSGVSAVKAVEQLGLQLEPRRVPVDTIIIDKIERVPSDN